MPKKTKIFLAILIVIIIILLIVVFASPKNNGQELPTPTPTVAPQGDSNILIQQETIKKDYPLIDKTPYRTPIFEVTYTGPLKLTVTMFDKKNEVLIKTQVEKWLKDNSVELSSHQIEYTTPKLPY